MTNATSNLKTYQFYGKTQHGPWTRMTRKYSLGTHRWVSDVKAETINKARGFLNRETFAPDRNSPGVQVIKKDWWHYDLKPEEAEKLGWIIYAPHLTLREVM